jgi:hypothetical protein
LPLTEDGARFVKQQHCLSIVTLNNADHVKLNNAAMTAPVGFGSGIAKQPALFRYLCRVARAARFCEISKASIISTGSDIFPGSENAPARL